MRGLSRSVAALLLFYGALGHVDLSTQTSVSAKPDNPEAQFELAKKYETGTGVENSLETAIELYEQAARHGHSQSMLRLGVLYYNGDVLGGTVKPDYELAWLWFTFAAAYGQSQAWLDAERLTPELHPSILRDLRMHAAGTLVEGNEVPANVEKGVELYRSAAQDGSAKAAEILGKLYLEGTRVPQDLGMASVWYEKAANAGSTRAMSGLAKLAESESPPKLAKAFELYRKAALKGDSGSMYRVGEMYAGGVGIPGDLVLADAWFTVAGYFEVAEGTAAARRLEAKLGREQIERAQREAHNFIVSVEPSSPSTPK